MRARLSRAHASVRPGLALVLSSNASSGQAQSGQSGQTPNGQIANAGIETLSARDMFWFHHYVGLAYSTTPVQMRTVIDNIQKMLNADPAVDRSSSRARFLRFSPSTLDIEVFAYVYAPGWERFLEIQQEFLLTIMEIVERAGTSIALPSQTLFVADSAGSMQTSAATARLIPSRDH